MSQISLSRIFFGSLLGASLLVFIASVIVTAGIHETRVRAKELIAVGPIASPELPSFDPHPSQDAINYAMNLFAIEIPENVRGPFFTPKLADRGLTMRRGVLSDAIVYIGPEAFSSWALLGSTLAHEIEIHGRQNFLAIHFQNLSGFDGTGIAEREAYSYELFHADRFGLSSYERDLIRSTMTYFYPEQENLLVQKFAPIRFWVDRMSATSLVKLKF